MALEQRNICCESILAFTKAKVRKLSLPCPDISEIKVGLTNINVSECFRIKLYILKETLEFKWLNLEI